MGRGGLSSTTKALSGPDRNAYNALVAIFKTFGLGELAPEILKLVKSGITDAGTVELELQDTSAWKTRFAGNELRRKAGLNVLDPGTYLQLENTYGAVLQQYGIPKGQYSKSDFADWIGKDISPQEIQSRVQLASQSLYNSDKYFQDSLAAFGIDRGHQISYFLDPKRAEPFLERQFQAATIGSSALRHGLQLDQNTALALATAGITSAQAEQGYSQISQALPRLNDLASIEGGTFGQSDAEKALFMGNAGAMDRIRQLSAEEAARFSGSNSVAASGVRNGLSASTQGAY